MTDIVKSAKTVVRVELSEYKGRNYVSIREWTMWDKKEPDVLKATQKGVNIEEGQLDALIDALTALKGKPESEVRWAIMVRGTDNNQPEEHMLRVLRDAYEGRATYPKEPPPEPNSVLYKVEYVKGKVKRYKRIARSKHGLKWRVL